jgi:DNA polymerase (family X)
MHTTASDGHNSISEMAEAALACGYKYIAITDHSKNLAMTNGLDEKRALEQIKQVRAVDRAMEGRIRVFTGIEVDILADGALDLDDEVLAQMDVVIASVHTRFEQSREEMTARVLRAIENPNVRILGHPTGRLLLRREPFAWTWERCCARGRAGRGHGAQCRSGAAGPERPRPAAGQRTGLQDRDELRLAR